MITGFLIFVLVVGVCMVLSKENIASGLFITCVCVVMLTVHNTEDSIREEAKALSRIDTVYVHDTVFVDEVIDDSLEPVDTTADGIIGDGVIEDGDEGIYTEEFCDCGETDDTEFDTDSVEVITEDQNEEPLDYSI